MANGKRWSDDDRARLQRMRAANLPPAEIAAALGRSVSAVVNQAYMQTPAGGARRRRLAQRYSSLEVPKDDPGIVGERAFADNFDETERRWREAFARAAEDGQRRYA